MSAHPTASDRDASLTPRPPGMRWGVALFFVLAYVLADSVTELFPHPRFGVQPWNLHAALAVALLANGGAGYLPLVLFAVLLGWAIEPAPRLDLIWFFSGIGMAASYWAGGLVLRRRTLWGRWGVRLRDVNVLLAVSVAIAMLCSAVEALRQFATLGMAVSSMPLLAWRLFVADLLGIVVWTPLLLQLQGGALAPSMTGARIPVMIRDGLLFLLVLAALLLLVFGFQLLDEFRTSYLLFLPMIAAAMRYGLPGVVATMPLVQLGLLVALATIGIRPGTAFEFQLLVLTLAVSSLFLGALNDERRRATARIAQHERTLRERSHALDEAQRIASTAELAAALAHDLSQPLSAIGSYARASQLLAARGDAERNKLTETLREISAETARAGQYLRRMREFFQTGAMHADRVSVASLFENTHAHMRDRLASAGVDWYTSIEPGLPPVRADAVQIGAVLGNLVANACDAMVESASPRRIQLRASRTPESGGALVRILVEDTGPGVRSDLRERLFKPLATSKPGGMGLGLALSRSIAERQGGRLWFKTECALTTFCLDLPSYSEDAGGRQ